MKTNIALRMIMPAMLIILSLFVFSACSQGENTDIQELKYEIERFELEIERLEREAEQLASTILRLENADNSPVISMEHVHILRECDGNCIELELPELWGEISGISRFKLGYNPEQSVINVREYIRVFENGNANVRLFPDGTFIANLFHNTKITGTYTEMTAGYETAVLFTYSGINNISGGISSFESTGLVTVVGGIVEDVLTIPIDWDDGHGHGMDFAFRAYPLVFIGDNDQRITLHADNTFEANLANDIRIIGFYGMRATSVTFVPGSPTFDRNGIPVGTFLLAELRTCGSDSIDNLVPGLGNDDDCDFDDIDIDTDPNSTLYPAESPAPTPTPTPPLNPMSTPTPAPSPNPTPNPVVNDPIPSPSPSPSPTEDDSTPASPAGDVDPPSTETPEDDDDDDNGLVWCDECGEYH